ncbi:unnamed protein product [Bursaphelenchus okinawaensis]|uniref:Uncharacterized protein n=1 Tax=Bursaphelenchus okinawaensis TaxID=465554 RepID=A0A811LWV4_9BILA|nr:unnamed protein product [Bursaphelenchus okinawaensis]CAG9128540.1 unnamed protein product [Bursaphelenchus okinawaensis]
MQRGHLSRRSFQPNAMLLSLSAPDAYLEPGINAFRRCRSQANPPATKTSDLKGLDEFGPTVPYGPGLSVPFSAGVNVPYSSGLTVPYSSGLSVTRPSFGQNRTFSTDSSRSSQQTSSNFVRSYQRTSLTQQMKRHLPWVLSSFRSSKRRQQVGQSTECQTTRLQSWDDPEERTVSARGVISSSRSVDASANSWSRSWSIRRSASEYPNVTTIQIDDDVDEGIETNYCGRLQKVQLESEDENGNQHFCDVVNCFTF